MKYSLIFAYITSMAVLASSQLTIDNRCVGAGQLDLWGDNGGNGWVATWLYGYTNGASGLLLYDNIQSFDIVTGNGTKDQWSYYASRCLKFPVKSSKPPKIKCKGPIMATGSGQNGMVSAEAMLGHESIFAPGGYRSHTEHLKLRFDFTRGYTNRETSQQRITFAVIPDYRATVDFFMRTSLGGTTELAIRGELKVVSKTTGSVAQPIEVCTPAPYIFGKPSRRILPNGKSTFWDWKQTLPGGSTGTYKFHTQSSPLGGGFFPTRQAEPVFSFDAEPGASYVISYTETIDMSATNPFDNEMKLSFASSPSLMKLEAQQVP